MATGIDDQQLEGSKSRYRFLFGDFSDLHRCALFEIQDAADNWFYGDIEIAAAALISCFACSKPRWLISTAIPASHCHGLPLQGASLMVVGRVPPHKEPSHPRTTTSP